MSNIGIRFISICISVNFLRVEMSETNNFTDNYDNTDLPANKVTNLNNNERTTVRSEHYENTTAEIVPSWHNVFNGIQAAMTAFGLFLNLLTIVTLKVNGRGFSPVIRLLLLHQAFADSAVCTCGLLTIVTPPMALVGNNFVSLLICQTWHTQGIYWSFIWVSIANLVVIAVERFIVICFPFKHGDLTKSTFCKVIIALYPLGVLVNIMGYFQLRYDAGVCYQEYYWSTSLFKKLMMGHAIWSFFNYYAIPCSLFFILYGGIVYMLYSRQQQSNLAQSNIIDAATKQMTNTAMVVTGWFIIALGYDLWYYVLGHNEVVVYEKGTVVQKVGIFLSTSNSCVNPIIYALFMPTYRHSLSATLKCQKQKSTHSSTSVSMSTINTIDE